VPHARALARRAGPWPWRDRDRDVYALFLSFMSVIQQLRVTVLLVTDDLEYSSYG
jgi:hypothetical protein